LILPTLDLEHERLTVSYFVARFGIAFDRFALAIHQTVVDESLDLDDIFITSNASQIIFKSNQQGKMTRFEEEFSSRDSSDSESGGEIAPRIALEEDESESGIKSEFGLFDDGSKSGMNDDESEIGQNTIDLSSDNEVGATATANDPTKAFYYFAPTNWKRAKTTPTQREHWANEVTGKLSWFAPPPDAPCHKQSPRTSTISTISSYGFATPPTPPTTTASEVLYNGVDTSVFYDPPPSPESPSSPAVPESALTITVHVDDHWNVKGPDGLKALALKHGIKVMHDNGK
jgi:hypothetical protein